jgi:hypothetical protein
MSNNSLSRGSPQTNLTVFISITIITKVSKELVVGYRLMVGRQILILDVEVRALVPEPIPLD